MATTYVDYLFVFINNQPKELETVIGPLWAHDGHCLSLACTRCSVPILSGGRCAECPIGLAGLGIFMYFLSVDISKMSIVIYVYTHRVCVQFYFLIYFFTNLLSAPVLEASGCVPVTGTDLAPTAVGHGVGQEDRWERVNPGCRCAVRKWQSGLGAKHPRSCTCPLAGPCVEAAPTLSVDGRHSTFQLAFTALPTTYKIE